MSFLGQLEYNVWPKKSLIHATSLIEAEAASQIEATSLIEAVSWIEASSQTKAEWRIESASQFMAAYWGSLRNWG